MIVTAHNMCQSKENNLEKAKMNVDNVPDSL